MKDSRVKTWVSQYQSILVRRMLLYWAVFQLSILNIMFIWGYLSDGERSASEYLAVFLPGTVPMLACFLFLAPFFCWDAVRLSHRLVGPLVRFRRAIQGLAAGERVARIELRKDDFLVDMKDDLNQLIGALQGQGDSPAAADAIAPANRTTESAHQPRFSESGR
jgi:hypothetical protein